jgi:hypothetical protein
MKIHFTYDEGRGVQHDGTYEFVDIAAAKAEAVRFIAQTLSDNTVGEKTSACAVAGFDETGNPIFTVRMDLVIEDAAV